MTVTEKEIAAQHKAAQTAVANGNLREAHQLCLRILQADRTHADAWFLCAVIAAANGQLAKAVEILHNAITLAPDNAEYHAELGKHLLAIREPEQALAAAEKASSLSPTQPTTLNTLGTLLSHCGEHERALSCFIQAQARLAESTYDLPVAWFAELHFNHATSLQFAGELEAAESAYEAAIDCNPTLFKAHSALAGLRRQTKAQNHLERLNALRNSVSSPRDQLHLGHAIAKEQEDLGEYEAALASLRWGKQRQAKAVQYDFNNDTNLFTCVRETFNSEWIQFHAANENLENSGNESAEPIFIVGMPRTGTTLVEQILASHSQVFGAGELQNFPLQVKRASESASSDLLDAQTLQLASHTDMWALGKAYIASTRPRTGHTPHFIDKLPLNFMYCGLIHAALPKAKIICLRRDPMDTCLSNYRQLFALQFQYYHYNYDLLDCGRYYIEFDRLIRHWQSVIPNVVYELQYETLVSQPETEAKKLLAHCNLTWEESCLSFPQSNTSVATPSATQVRQGIYRTSINRWQRYGSAMRPLHELLSKAGLYQ